MNRVLINLEALQHNLNTIDRWMKNHGASWTVVTKVCCGHRGTIRALKHFDVHSIGDSRLENLHAIEGETSQLETWYLRMPGRRSVDEIVRLTDVSLNSEITSIKALSEEATKQDRKHGVVIMIELGDLREGILPGSLVRFYKEVFELPNIRVLGIGANLGCLAGAVPTVDQFMQLVLYRELLELKFGRKLPLISGGSTVSLPLVLDLQMPRAINHFRIGEGLFLGTDLVSGGTLPGLRADTIVLETEIIEIKKKGLVPLGETSNVAPFHNEQSEDFSPGQRGFRALVDVGQLDTHVEGLTPENPTLTIAGASSDITVLNVGEGSGGLRVGDRVRFHLDYAAMLRLMGSQYVERVLVPPLEELAEVEFTDEVDVDATPALRALS